MLAALSVAAQAQREATLMTNPVLFADVPDLDIIRVGKTYYMVSTTMHFAPGCGIMKSEDLVNWEIVNYAYDELDEGDKFRLLNGQSDYSQGSWAANLRYDPYERMFYMIMTCNTTGKTYFYVTDDIEHGKWHCSMTDKCYDPGLLFEDTGTSMKKYVLHPADTFADHAMYLREISVDSDWNVTVGERHKVIDYANLENPARGLRAEGYHGYKIGDYYYIFMIQGCDGQRQEIVWRSKSLLDGQWEGRMVFGGEMVDEQGTVVMQTNGIGQGGIVETPDGQWWCFLFKDYGSVGRMPIWLPMTWSEDGWPIVGNGTTEQLPAGRNMTTPYRVNQEEQIALRLMAAGAEALLAVEPHPRPQRLEPDRTQGMAAAEDHLGGAQHTRCPQLAHTAHLRPHLFGTDARGCRPNEGWRLGGSGFLPAALWLCGGEEGRGAALSRDAPSHAAGRCRRTGHRD